MWIWFFRGRIVGTATGYGPEFDSQHKQDCSVLRSAHNVSVAHPASYFNGCLGIISALKITRGYIGDCLLLLVVRASDNGHSYRADLNAMHIFQINVRTITCASPVCWITQVLTTNNEGHRVSTVSSDATQVVLARCRNAIWLRSSLLYISNMTLIFIWELQPTWGHKHVLTITIIAHKLWV
jgi:hypothetical protein